MKIELLSQTCFIGILVAARLETAQNYFQTRITIGKAKRKRERENSGGICQLKASRLYSSCLADDRIKTGKPETNGASRIKKMRFCHRYLALKSFSLWKGGVGPS